MNTSTSLAQQALSNLVKQFARPLDFLRELVQNSIDAGTPRIEISVDYEHPNPDEDGVLIIEVRDFGEGMNEEIIDGQLTRLFSSTKENDLTKIGKFGIGFTSIFAIAPEAVLLRTGREGEYWEVLFHADRSFDKTRVQEPIVGTQLLMYRTTPPAEVPDFISEARRVLGYWCQHSDVPILWWDRTQEATEPEPNQADPLAAFAQAEPDRAVSGHGTPEQVNRPLELEGDVVIHHDADGTQAVLAYQSPESYGFYNGGLTLLQTHSKEALGQYEWELGHVSFKLKNDRLEHTLTRDNVIQDDHWVSAMELMRQAHQELIEALLQALRVALDEGRDPERLQRYLIEDIRRAKQPKQFLKRVHAQPVVQSVFGKPVSTTKLCRQIDDLGFCLLGSADCGISKQLHESGLVVVPDSSVIRSLVHQLRPPPLFTKQRPVTRFMTAHQAFCMPDILDPTQIGETERLLLERTQEVLEHAMGLRISVSMPSFLSGSKFLKEPLRYVHRPGLLLSRITLKIGDFGGTMGRRDVLCLNGPTDTAVFLRPRPKWMPWPAVFQRRTLLVNRSHPLYRAQRHASALDLDIAATGLAMALLNAEDIEAEFSYQFLIAGMCEEVQP